MAAADSEKQRGASLIEFALVLPVFLTLIVGILFYGIAFFSQQAVNFAAQRGAEAAVSVDPDVVNFRDLARKQANIRISELLPFFPGGVPQVSLGELNQGNCGAPSPDDAEPPPDPDGSFICVSPNEAGRRTVIVRLSSSFQSLWGFPQTTLIPAPGNVKGVGSSVVAGNPNAP